MRRLEFKKVNDTYGHEVGDEVLTNLARVISRSIATPDYSGSYAIILRGEHPLRIGGEEFVILLPGYTLEQGVVAARRLCSTVRTNFRNQDVLPKITVSGGVSSFWHTQKVLLTKRPLITDTIVKAMYVFSDTGLYDAKCSGKNCVKGFDKVLAAPMSNTLTEKLGFYRRIVLAYQKTIT